MRKPMASLLAALLLLPAIPSRGESYTLAGIPATIDLPSEVYTTVLTPETLEEKEGDIRARGESPEGLRAEFEAKGILLKAYDDKNDRVLLVTALADTDSGLYHDINAQDAAARARYRASHGKGGPYAKLGYSYDSVAWKNFPKVGRFLMLRYALRQDGKLVCRGFQRRTIRNGLTVTIDLQVYGKQLSGGDNAALNRVFDSFAFSATLPAPVLPVPHLEDAPPPEETDKASFRMKGRTAPEARLTAVIIPLSTNKAQVYEVTADKKGAYSIDVLLPAEGFYVMTLSIEAEGMLPLEKQYSINYEEGMLPLSLDARPPEVLESDKLTLSGKTMAGVSVELNVNGQTRRATTPASGRFSFSVDTARAGNYSISLLLRKTGYDTRSFEFYTERRTPESQRFLEIRDNALYLAPEDFEKGPESYAGRIISFEGVIVARRFEEEEWVILITPGDVSDENKSFVSVSTREEPVFGPGDRVRVYGEWVGLGSALSANGEQTAYPVVRLEAMEALTGADLPLSEPAETLP